MTDNKEKLENEAATEAESSEAVAENTESKEAEETKEPAKCEKDGKYKKENKRLTEELKKSEDALAESQDRYLRLVAEYDNFRKRSAKEKEGIYADAYADCIGAILPVIDNLERALQYAEGDKVVEGVRMTMNQFADTLQKLGVEVIETTSFDPTYHNAVMHVEDEAYGEGEIVDVFQKGYKKGDKVIRYAMVKVAN